MISKEVLEYLRTCKFCKIVMGTDYENDDRYPTIYDIFYEEIEIIEKDLNRLEELEKENAKLKKVIEDIKNLPDCDICDSNWHKGCMCLQNKFKKALINNNFTHMFDNCKLTPLPELEELKNVKD